MHGRQGRGREQRQLACAGRGRLMNQIFVPPDA
jgi:hypothetical protein